MHGEYKVPGGKLVVVDTDVEEDRLARVSVSGDFFLDPDDVLTRITASLEGAPASSSAKDLAARVEAALHEGDTLMGVTPEAVGIAVRRALGAVGNLAPSTSIEPHYRGEHTEPRTPRGSDHDLADHHPTKRRAHTRPSAGVTELINLGDQP